MHNYFAKQSQTGTGIKVHAFKSMQERDAWVKENYDALNSRQCSAVEAKKLANPEDVIEH